MKTFLISMVLAIGAVGWLSAQRPTDQGVSDVIIDSISRRLAPSRTQAMSWLYRCDAPSDASFDSIMSNADISYDGFLTTGGIETVWLSDQSHRTFEQMVASSTQCCRYHSSWFMRLMYSYHRVYFGWDSLCDSSAYLVDSSGTYLFDMVALDMQNIIESKYSDRQLVGIDSVRRYFLEWVDYVSDSGIAMARSRGYSPLPHGYSWWTFEHRRRMILVEDLDKLLEQ